MYISSDSFRTAYNNIVSRSRGTSSSTTFILVSPDVDAICAAHILHDLLKTDNIINTIIPVASWSELQAVQDRLVNEEVRSLILLNLGALVDLADYFSYLPSTTLIHVIDSHRPVNLANLYVGAPYASALFDARRGENLPEPELSVVVWNDAEGDEEMRLGEKEAFEALQYEPDSDSDSDSDSDEELGRGRRGGSGSGSDEDEDGSPKSGKRRRTSNEPQPLSKIQRRRYRARITKYYTGGTYSGQSVASQIFLLAVNMERADEDSVWLAILGLTYQFTTSLIDRERYDAYVRLLADEVARLSTTPESLRFSSDPAASSGPNDRSIRPSDELRFCLVRHWNLYDAMYHSGYVAGRMKLWKERGRKNLSGMLAKMGYSLQQCQQTYAHMDSDLKNGLFAKVDELAPEYGLHDLTFPSFIRKSGYRSDISSSDAVEGIGALLEVATGVRLDFGNGGVGAGGGGREEWAEGVKRWVERDEDKENRGVEEEEEAGEGERKEREWGIRNFWLAWDALSADTTLLRASLPLSMALHRAVIRQGTYMLDKQSIKTTRSYRLAIFDEGPDLAVFRHPSTLLRLAIWLVDAVRDLIGQGAVGGAKGKIKSLPFVLASLNETKDLFLVVGVVGAVEYGDVKKNSFGLAFQKAAEQSNARTRHNSFEASVVEVRKDDLAKFLQLLPLL